MYKNDLMLPPVKFDWIGLFNPAWAIGLLILWLVIFWRIIPLEGGALNWALFVSIAFGVVPLGLALGRIGGETYWKPMLALMPIISTVFLVTKDPSVWVLVISVISSGIILKMFSPQKTIGSWAAVCGILLITWTAAVKLIWWLNFDRFITLSVGSCAIAVWATVVAIIFTYGRSGAMVSTPRLALVDVLALVIFSMAGTRVAGDFVDESFIVGSAQLVRDGGWLLWSVPSQYGFLNIWLLAHAPFETVWQSLYFLNSLLLTLQAALIYAFVTKLKSGWMHRVFSLIITLAATLMLPGWAPELTGPNLSASVSAFRFIWCFALLYVIFEIALSRQVFGKKKQRQFLPENNYLIGSCIWTVGCLWSFENVIFCSAIWIPFLLIMSWRGGLQWRKFIILFIPFIVIALTICVIYIYKVGGMPDFRSYFEYALIYQGGFGSLPMKLTGGIWVPVVIFSILIAGASSSIGRNSDIPMILYLSTLCFLWATVSYFVSRSHENNITNLTPQFLMALAAGLRILNLFSKGQELDIFRWLMRAAMMPFIAVILIATYGNVIYLGRFLSTMTMSRNIASIQEIEFPIPQSLRELMIEAKFQPDDPIEIMGQTVMPDWRFNEKTYRDPRHWLPFGPATQIGILPLERQILYMERYLQNPRKGGWLLHNKFQSPVLGSREAGGFQNNSENFPYASTLAKTHYKSKEYENAEWKLERYEPNL